MKLFHKMFFLVFVGMMFVGNVNAMQKDRIKPGISGENLKNNISNPAVVMGTLAYIGARENIESKRVKAFCDAAGAAALSGGTAGEIVAAGGIGLGVNEISDTSYAERMSNKISVPYVSKKTQSWWTYVFQTVASVFIGKEVAKRADQFKEAYSK